MKLFAILLSLVLLLPSLAFAEETMQIDRRTTTVTPDPDTYESIINEVDREDRMERCISRLQREYSEMPGKDFSAACERIYANLDSQNMARAELRERFQLSLEEAEKLAMMKQERLERVERLSEEQVQRMASLEIQNLEKVAALNQERLQRIADLDEAQLQKLSMMSRGEIEKLSEMSMEQIRERLRETSQERVSPEDAGNRRDVAKERIDEAKKNFASAKERFESAKEDYEKAREEFSRLAAAENEACETAGEDCEQARERSMNKAKEYLNHLAEQQLAYLEQMRERVRASEGLSANEANDILEDLDEHEARIIRAQEFLETATSKEEVKQAGKSLTKTWRTVEVKVEDRREQLMYREGKKYVHQSEALEAKMDRMLAALDDKGVDTSLYEDEVEKFSDLVAQANEKLDEGRDYFEEFRTSDTPADDMDKLEAAKVAFNEAHALLREANQVFNDLKELIWEDTEEDFEEEEDEVEIVISNDPSISKPSKLDGREVTIE